MMRVTPRHIGLTALAGFLLHGQFAAALPVLEPLQLPLAGLAALCALPGVLPLRRSVIGAVIAFLIAAAFVLQAPPVVYQTPYADSKPTTLLLTLAFTLVLPPLLIRTRADLRYLIGVIGALCLAVVALALPALPGMLGSGARLVLGEEGNPIWLARAAGVAGLWVAWRVMTGQMRRAGLLLTLPALAVLIGTGSRGPLLASLIGTLLLTLATRPRVRPLGVAAALLGMAALGAGLGSAPLDDLSGAFSRGMDPTAGRGDLIATAWQWIQTTPRGMGVGGLDAWIVPRYPHNIVAEATAELGWVAGGALVAALIAVIARYASAARRAPEFAFTLALTVYATLNAMVSGDLTSPKELYLMASVALIPLFRSPAWTTLSSPVARPDTSTPPSRPSDLPVPRSAPLTLTSRR